MWPPILRDCSPGLVARRSRRSVEEASRMWEGTGGWCDTGRGKPC
jgi:hypothetical protein